MSSPSLSSSSSTTPRSNKRTHETASQAASDTQSAKKSCLPQFIPEHNDIHAPDILDNEQPHHNDKSTVELEQETSTATTGYAALNPANEASACDDSGGVEIEPEVPAAKTAVTATAVIAAELTTSTALAPSSSSSLSELRTSDSTTGMAVDTFTDDAAAARSLSSLPQPSSSSSLRKRGREETCKVNENESQVMQLIREHDKNVAQQKAKPKIPLRIGSLYAQVMPLLLKLDWIVPEDKHTKCRIIVASWANKFTTDGGVMLAGRSLRCDSSINTDTMKLNRDYFMDADMMLDYLRNYGFKRAEMIKPPPLPVADQGPVKRRKRPITSPAAASITVSSSSPSSPSSSSSSSLSSSSSSNKRAHKTAPTMSSAHLAVPPRYCYCCKSDIAMTKAVLLSCECKHAFCLDCARGQLFETMRNETIGIGDVSVYCPSCKQSPVVSNERKGSNLVASSVLASLAAEQDLVCSVHLLCTLVVMVVYPSQSLFPLSRLPLFISCCRLNMSCDCHDRRWNRRDMEPPMQPCICAY